MNIERILLTDAEVKQAIEILLRQSGIDVTVKSFEKNWRGDGWEISSEVKPEFLTKQNIPVAKTLTDEIKDMATGKAVVTDYEVPF